MGVAQRFEDLIAWQKVRLLTRAAYRVTRTGAFAKDYGLKDQIQRASVSVIANVAEGFERQSLGEFHQFLTIARASCAEVRSHLYVAFDADYLDEDTFKQLLASADEVGRVVSGLRATVANRRGEKR